MPRSWFRRPAEEPAPSYPDWLSYEPRLIPPLAWIRGEAVPVVEEWFRWGEEWSLLLRAFAALRSSDRVLEIGCGAGRIAFALRYYLEAGEYHGFDPMPDKIAFASGAYWTSHANYHFAHADVRNTYYHPAGRIEPTDFRFPYDDESFDVVFAASVFTHMAPANVAHYFRQAARVLKPGGRCMFSFFLLDNRAQAASRPSIFGQSDFEFTHRLSGWGDEFGFSFLDDPERMTAYSLPLVERFAREAGLSFAREPLMGMWSGRGSGWVSTQDIVVLRR
jgi:SAM-dependent methyltransferase